MKDKIVYWILALITILGFIIRVWNITTNPPELFSDEIKGYNSARSIIETGKDINGNLGVYFYDKLELYPPIYGYLAYITSLIVHNKTLAIRLPAVIAGTLAIVTVFFLSGLLFKKTIISVFSAFFYAFIPWSIHYSRIGWEPSLLILSLTLPIIFFKLFIDKNKELFFFLSCVFFGLSVYSYRSLELLAPLFLTTLIVLYWKNIKHKLTTFFGGIVVFSFLTIPYLHASLNQPLMHQRAIGISTFKDGLNMNSMRIFVNNYIAHFSPNFLFIKGDPNLRHNAGTGELFWIMLPLILFGMFYLIKNYPNKESKLLIIWLLVYPLGGSLTNDGVPHATRTLIGSPLFAILSSIGLYFLCRNFPKLTKLFIGVAILINIFEVLLFTKTYFRDYPIISADSWEYGQKILFSAINNSIPIGNTICLTNLNYWHKETLIRYYLGTNKKFNICDDSVSDCCNKANIVVSDISTKIDKKHEMLKTIYDLSGNPQWIMYKILP